MTFVCHWQVNRAFGQINVLTSGEAEAQHAISAVCMSMSSSRYYIKKDVQKVVLNVCRQYCYCSHINNMEI